MTDIELAEFVQAYQAKDKGCFDCRWELDSEGDEVDTNHEFRYRLIDFVLTTEQAVPSLLLSDLLEAETDCSVRMTGAIDELAPLAEKMLRQVGAGAVLDFVRCKYKTFDTEMAMVPIDLPKSLLHEIIEFCEQAMLKDDPDAVLYSMAHHWFSDRKSQLSMKD